MDLLHMLHMLQLTFMGKNTRLTCIHSQAWEVTVGVWQVNIHLGGILGEKADIHYEKADIHYDGGVHSGDKVITAAAYILETNIKAGKHWRPADIHVLCIHY